MEHAPGDHRRSPWEVRRVERARIQHVGLDPCTGLVREALLGHSQQRPRQIQPAVAADETMRSQEREVAPASASEVEHGVDARRFAHWSRHLEPTRPRGSTGRREGLGVRSVERAIEVAELRCDAWVHGARVRRRATHRNGVPSLGALLGNGRPSTLRRWRSPTSAHELVSPPVARDRPSRRWRSSGRYPRSSRSFGPSPRRPPKRTARCPSARCRRSFKSTRERREAFSASRTSSRATARSPIPPTG